MRSEGFPFLVGGLGVGPVFASHVSCRRLSSSLVVSRRLSSFVVVVSSKFGKSCKRVSFLDVSRVASPRYAWHAWHFVTCGRVGSRWVTCRKSFCVAGAILLRRFPKMLVIFRGRRKTLDVSIFIWRGRRSTSDMSSCLFSANRIGRAA